MKIKIVGKDKPVSTRMSEKIEKKLAHLNKYVLLDEDDVANVLIRSYPNKEKIEVTIPTKFAVLRAEVADYDLSNAIDQVVDKLEDQIRRQKTRLMKRSNKRLAEAFLDQDFMPLDEEAEDDQVVKTKSIVPEVMSLDDAIMNMNLVGHDFYIYTDDETKKIAVVYIRHDGGYGLIETE